MSPLSKNQMREVGESAARDPVFAAIAAHRASLAAREAAEAVYHDDEEGWAAAYELEAKLHRRLFVTRATSLEGAQLFAAYVSEIPNIAEYEGEHFSAVRAMSTLAAALLEISLQSISAGPSPARRRLEDFDVAAGKTAAFRFRCGE